MKSLRALVAILPVLAGLAGAQSDFQSLHERWIKGEKVQTELAEMAGDQARKSEERFNASYLLGIIALQNSSLDEAKQHLDRCDTLKAGTAQTAVRRAELLLLQSKHDEALKECEKAGKKITDGKSALGIRHQIVQARIEIAKGDAKKAGERLDKLAKSQKKDWEIHFFLGRAYEMLDKPKDCLEAFETCIQNLPQEDPCIGVYALQRWAAIAVSSDKGSYGNPKLLEKAVERYKAFLARGTKNDVPEELLDNVEQTIRTLEMFGKREEK